MSTITSESPLVSPVVGSVDGPAHPVSDMIDPTEILYRLTVEEYEQIAGFLNDDRVELIDGYLVKKMNKNPPHVIRWCRAAVERAHPLVGTADQESLFASGDELSQSQTCLSRVERSMIIRTPIPHLVTSPLSSKSRTQRWQKTGDAGEFTGRPALQSIGSST